MILIEIAEPEQIKKADFKNRLYIDSHQMENQEILWIKAKELFNEVILSKQRPEEIGTDIMNTNLKANGAEMDIRGSFAYVLYCALKEVLKKGRFLKQL